MFEQKGKGLFEVEEFGGCSAGDEQGFRELPLHLLGDLTGDRVRGQARGQGDTLRGKCTFGVDGIAGFKQRGAGSGNAQMIKVICVAAEGNRAWQSRVCSVDRERGGQGIAFASIGEMLLAGGLCDGSKDRSDTVECAAAGIATFVLQQDRGSGRDELQRSVALA